MDGKTLPSILNEAMEIKSETELIPPKGYIGVYHKATRYSDGKIRAPMTFVSPSIFAHLTHPFQKMEFVDTDGQIELCTGYYHALRIDVVDNQRFFSFRKMIASELLQHIKTQSHSSMQHAYDIQISKALIRELRGNQCQFAVYRKSEDI
uniref:Uncharacterized protein n=1 Tax=Panagrolaimus sp. ES5 TaxID=591445 RepID=A0AC34GF83_9BILA